MNKVGRITISRRNSDIDNYVVIALRGDGSPLPVIEIRLTYEQFGTALAGMGNMPCEWSESGKEWISVDKQLPDEGVPVIVTAKHLHGTPSVYFSAYHGMEGDEAKWWDLENTNSYNEYRDLYNVTHWMPQPEPKE